MNDYNSLPGLNYSGMKDLAVSPLRYWHLHVNPNRPEPETTSAMAFGSALHCKVLEPDQFDSRHYKAFNPGDYPGALRTIDDIRGWLSERGVKAKGTRKADLVQQVVEIDPEMLILDVLEGYHARDVGGREILSADFWRDVHGAAGALHAEPSFMALLERGIPEVRMTATDPKTGVPLKCRADLVGDGWILDVKTFSQQRGKSIDKTITDALWFDHYLWQAYLYSYIRSLQPGAPKIKDSRFIFAFVESTEPYEVRLREIVPVMGEVNMYWEWARNEVNALIRQYSECLERWGENPWRGQAEVNALVDEEIKQLAWI